ncbi:MAG: metallophosphoesterase, partial [Luteolibacter sp.]
NTADNVGLFSFGTAAATDRALGSRATSNVEGNAPVLYGVRLVNGTGLTLTKFTITYTGEQWFKSTQTTAHALFVDYQLGSAGIAVGTWNTLTSASFTSPISTGTTATALNGNSAANRTVQVVVAGAVSWAPGQELWIRIRDENESGSEQGLAVDDFHFLADNESGLFFNGSTAHLTMGYGAASAAAFGTADFTIECRFLRTGGGVSASSGTGGVTAVPLIAKGVGEADGDARDANYFLGIDVNGRLTADFEQRNATNNGTAYAAGQNFPITGSTTLQNGVWYHVAASYNTTTATWKLYVNGIEETTSIPSGSPTAFVGVVPRFDSLQGLGIGTTINSIGTVSGFFQGVIDEVRIWNIARSSSQILAGKDAEIVSGQTGMLARFGMDEATGTSVAGTTAAGVATPIGNLSGATSPVWVNANSFSVNAGPSSGTVVRGPYLQKAAATQMAVCWRGSQSAVGRVRYGTDVMNLSRYKDDASAPASPFNHVITLTGLTAGTTYYYSVGSAADTLASGSEYTFTTPPLTGSVMDTRVWVLGDAGTATSNQIAVRDAFYTWTGARTPNLVLQLGDNAYSTGTDQNFTDGMFNIYTTMLHKTPFWSCLGNHETNQATANVDTYPYFDIYTLPTTGECGGVASGTEHYYSFDYGNIHFIALDSMTAVRSVSGAMATWLQSDLASTTATWIICFFHHPPYTKGSHNSDTDIELIQMRSNILPILEAGGVDLVLCGHSHCYERSYLLDGHYGLSTSLTSAMKKNAGDGKPGGNGAYVKPLTGTRDHFGAVYAVTGSAGQATNWTGGSTAAVNPTPHPAMYASLLSLGSLVLDINGTRLDATFLRNNSSTPDSFTIIKQGFADSDADGISDEYEIAHGLNRFNAADAALDSDGDGVTNLREFIFSTASNVSDRYTFSTAYNKYSGTNTLTFTTATGRNYRVMYSNDLLSWQPVTPAITGTGAAMLWTDDGTTTGSSPSAAPKRFYRIEVTVAP